MNNDSLLTTPLTREANQIINAINTRSKEIQEMIKNISVSKKCIQNFAKSAAVITGLAAAASIPAALIQMSFEPLFYGCIAFGFCASSSVALMFLDTRSPTEAIIKDQWQSLFLAIKKSEGASIIEKCEMIIQKRNEHGKAFAKALSHAPQDIIDPFLQKTLFTGYLLNALHCLDNDDGEKAKSYAHLALSSFVLSGLPRESGDCAHAIINKPGRVINRLNQCGCPKTISDLDAFISMMPTLLPDEHAHDFVRI